MVILNIWKNHRDHDHWQRKQDQQALVLEIHRELTRQHDVLLSRCSGLERTLSQHGRALRNISDRLS